MSLSGDEEEIFLACRYGDLEEVQSFVKTHTAASLANIRDENGNSILHMISANGHLELLEYLLPLLPSNSLAAQNESGSTPLHWAALNAHLEVTKKIVQYPEGPGRDLIDIKNKAGHSPLSEAELAGWDEGARWLVEVMNLDLEGAQGEATDEAVLDTDEIGNRDIDVEIEDADGEIARMTISGTGVSGGGPSNSKKDTSDVGSKI